MLIKPPYWQTLTDQRPGIAAGGRDSSRSSQDQSLAWQRLLSTAPWLDGQMIQNVTATGAGTVVVQHTLRRLPKGWIMMKLEADGSTSNISIHENAAPTSTQLSFRVSAAFDRLDLWVF